MILAAVITAASVVFLVREKHGPAFKTDVFAGSSGWGYRITLNDTIRLIDQPMIPGREGNTGFRTREEAQKTADLVVAKLKKGILPPSVSRKELDSLGIK